MFLKSTFLKLPKNFKGNFDGKFLGLSTINFTFLYWSVSLAFIWPSWLWSYGSWIYNYIYNRCLSPLMLWVRLPLRARCTTLCDKVCQLLETGLWFSPGPPVSSTNKTDCHNITKILLKVALNTMKSNLNLMCKLSCFYREVYAELGMKESIWSWYELWRWCKIMDSNPYILTLLYRWHKDQ